MARKWSIILTIFCLFLIFDFIELIKAQRYRKKQKYERINFNNHRRAISEEAPTFSPPRDWPIDLREGQKLNKTMSCATSLVDQYTEVCELVYRIGQLHQLLPHLNELIVKRMGGRKFIFTIYMNRSSSTVDMLTDAGKALLRCIGKFIRFLGYVEKLFSATMGTSETSIDKNSLNRRGFFGPPERTGFLGEVSNTATVNEDEIQRNVKKAWSRKCSLELLKWENDICGIISRITKLDGLLKNSILELEPSVSSMTIPVKLSSEKLSLTDFFDALHVALLKARNIKDFEGRRAAEIKTKYIGGKRILLNDKEEPVEEIFETPEFKIELIKNDRRKKIIYLPERKRGTTSKPPAGNRRDARNRGRGRFSNHRHKFGGISISLPEQIVFQQNQAPPPYQERSPDYSDPSMRRLGKDDPYPFYKPRRFFDELFSSSWGDDDGDDDNNDYGGWGMNNDDYNSDNDENDYGSAGWGIGGFNPGYGGYPGGFFPAPYDKDQFKF